MFKIVRMTVTYGAITVSLLTRCVSKVAKKLQLLQLLSPRLLFLQYHTGNCHPRNRSYTSSDPNVGPANSPVDSLPAVQVICEDIERVREFIIVNDTAL